ncbi:MAG: ADP-ribosylglycohydrolase family protein [Verrucomicrobiota bacterium]
MDTELRKQAAILGAFTADAASLGYHWLYDSSRIHELAAGTPEFHTPNPDDYDGVSGYFAHGHKSSGDLTHYGVHLWTAIDSLHAHSGKWNSFDYQARFCRTFDRGGSFSGYIDTATSGTLDNYFQSNKELMDKSLLQVEDVSVADLGYMRTFITKYGLIYQGKALIKAIDTLFSSFTDDTAVVEKAKKVAKYYDKHRTLHTGADDNQIPAFSKVPAVVVAELGESKLIPAVDDAVRITNNNDEAVTYAVYAARVLEKVLLGTRINDALRTSLSESPDYNGLHHNIERALESETLKPAQLAETFGATCSVPSAIPLSVAIMNQCPDYTEAIRINIMAGGDSAGRAIFLGSILGAAEGIGGNHGIPLNWISKLTELDAICEAVDLL